MLGTRRLCQLLTHMSHLKEQARKKAIKSGKIMIGMNIRDLIILLEIYQGKNIMIF